MGSAQPAEDSTDDMATSQICCTCDTVKIVFAGNRPRFHAECCCVDCLQKQLYAHSLGGNRVPDEVLDFKRGLDLLYFENDIIEARGEDHLIFRKLRDRASSTQCSCS